MFFRTTIHSLGDIRSTIAVPAGARDLLLRVLELGLEAPLLLLGGGLRGGGGLAAGGEWISE